jgi:hypothetical protein
MLTNFQLASGAGIVVEIVIYGIFVLEDVEVSGAPVSEDSGLG